MNKKQNKILRLQLFIMISMNITIFRNVTPCTLTSWSKCFCWTYWHNAVENSVRILQQSGSHLQIPTSIKCLLKFHVDDTHTY